MAIRIFLFIFSVTQGLCFSQNMDSLDAKYKQFYDTALLTVSPSGQYVVLNHNSAYGKDGDELIDLKIGKSKMLDKHDQYDFLGDHELLMRSNDHVRFLNLKTGEQKDVQGNYMSMLANSSQQVILYNTGSKELVLSNNNGHVRWTEKKISAYQLEDAGNHLVYVSGSILVVRNLKNEERKTYQLENNVQWLASYGKKVYCAHIQASIIELYVVDLLSGQLKKQVITSPEAFEWTTGLNSYFEVRENEHFIFPLYLKSQLNAKENPELHISYSNRNGKAQPVNHYLGIYNIKEEKWDFQPDERLQQPVYKFLNGKGDFVVFDQSDDVTEEEQNAVLDLKLILDYGKSFSILPQKRTDDGNYLWDRRTKQFVYFNGKRWMCHQLGTEKDHELLPAETHGWEDLKNNGLQYSPHERPIKITGTSKIMLSNQSGYFIVDLTNCHVERITTTGDQHLHYRLQVSKNQYPKSSWNVRLAEIDIEKEMTFKLFNTLTYDTGFAAYTYKNNHFKLYRQGHYQERIPYRKGFFLTSYFALEPFQLTKFESGKYNLVHESLKTEKKGFGQAKCQIFQYQTNEGISNAAILYPTDYDPQKKFPMIVNIYEKMSLDVLKFLPPYIKTTFGFNYMHYLMNGYLVLLPDLQYSTGGLNNSMITSLEKSIDTAELLANVDRGKIGIIGLSFGGYQTGLALTGSRYFKTGVAGVMVSDLVSHSLSYSEFDAKPNYRRTEHQQVRMKDNVFENWNSYMGNSPIYHLKNINTPVLIWTGSKDRNISPMQSRIFFLGLKRLQKKAVLLEYRNETHNVFLPSNQLDLNVRIWQWFEHFLKNKPPADWINPVHQ